ncbi:hypothetical protein HYH03_014481 [Edaphochlamys debaryana]|uniref:Uncharacterized protein n=1 Tax=Edaphochlamys debaryana TaxID=47281 RepID=A0A835XL88_9CHLO|nr:hypothetical protein HYH03_014481 [Edaphochlamys debaryana]|eukprot:KAG2486887.1 hypothetical protein HYH03_014481 [Edaphochlamys debaryana]
MATGLLAPERLLYSRSLLKFKPGDHVDEVHFASPVVVSRIVLVDTAKQQGAQPGLLRVFARDLQYPSASRFAPLCPSNLSAATGASLLPLDSIPPPLLEALRGAADLYREVGRDRERICSSEAQSRLAPVMWAAKAVHRALAGQTSELELALATAPPRDRGPLARGELASFAEMACDWCLLLASGRCSRLPEANVAMAGLAAAVVLAGCAPAAPVLLAMGGAAAVVRALSAANPPADLVRLAVTACDALTLCCPGPAAEALLGRYEPPPPPREEEQAAEAVAVKVEPLAGPDAVKEEAEDGKRGADASRQEGEDPDPSQVPKTEGACGLGPGGGTYGDAEAPPGEEEDDDGRLGRSRDPEEANHNPALEAGAVGEAGVEHGDPSGEVRDRVRRASSGALGQAEDGAAEDGMYDGFYDDFDDYYGGEEYEGDGGAEVVDPGAADGDDGADGGIAEVAGAGSGGGAARGEGLDRDGGRSPSRSRSRSRSGSRGGSGTRSSSSSSDANADAEMRDDDGDGVLTSAAADAQAGSNAPPTGAAPAVKAEPGRGAAAGLAEAKPSLATVLKVMRRLTAADLAAKVLGAASSLAAAAPAGGATSVGPAAAAAAAMEAMAPLRQLVAALPDLAEVAAAATSGNDAGGKTGILGGELSALTTAAASARGGDGRPQIPVPPSLDAPTLQIMASRPLFVALAAALAALQAHAGALRRALDASAAMGAAGAGVATQQAAAAGQQAGAYAQQHLTAAHAALLAGLRLMLVPLLSCSAGLAWLTSAAARPGVIALIAALDPTTDDAAFAAAGLGAAAARRAVAPNAAAAATAAGGGAGSGPAAELAAMLCDALAADAAAKALAGTSPIMPQGSRPASAITVQPDQAAIYGPMGPIILTLLHMVHGSDVGRQAAVQALSSSRPAMSTLLRAVRMRARAAKALALAASGSGSGGGGGMLYDEEDDLEVSLPSESLYASSLLLAVTRDTRLQSLVGWLPIAAAIADAARAEAELLSGAAYAEILTGLGCQPDVLRRMARELQGRAEAGAALTSGGSAALVRLLDEGLPRLEQTRRGAPADVDPRAAATLVRGGAERAAGVASTALELIATLLRAPSAKYTATELYGMGAMAVFERAVRTGVAAVRAAAADGVWASLGGDSLDAGDRARGRRTAVALLNGAMSALAALLLALQPLAVAPPPDSVVGSSAVVGLKLRNRSVLQALLTAHATAVLSYDSLAASLAGGAAAGASGMPGAPTTGHELLPARLAVAAALGAWVEAGWEPEPLSTAFGLAHSYLKEAESERAHMGLGYILSGGPGPSASDGFVDGGSALAFREPAAAALRPEACYCLLQLLGDVFPREWPPTPGPGQLATAFPPPSCMARRSALASALEQVSAQFLRLLSFGYNSESRLVRCAAVRTAARAAGLGGGMPSFLAAPLVEALAALVRGQAAGAAPGPGPGPLTDARRLLEVLAPLAYKPAIKAALLDARAVSVLSRLLHRLVSTAMGPAPPAGSAAALDPADVPVVVGQALEALRLLADPDISLSPAAPREKRLQEDVPPLPEATAMVTALLACLPHLGANAPLAAQLLASPAFGLATYAAGRAALRAGAGKWLTAQAGIGAGGGSELGRALEALRWAAQRLRASADSARANAAAGAAGQEAVAAAAACVEVAFKLEEVATNSKESDLEGDFPPPLPAPQRFVAAVAAATEAAAPATSSTAASGTAAPTSQTEDAELEAGGHGGAWWPWPAVCDNATQSFWRYCRARPVRGNPSRKLTRWDCPNAASTNTASLLPPEPLSRRRRPRDVPAAVSAALPRPASETGSASGGGVTPSALTSSSLDDDIPTITAPRRRGDGRGRGSSRAPSKHVDDYQRSTQPPPAAPSAPGPAAAPPGRGAMAPPPPRPPAVQALPPPPQQLALPAPPPPMAAFGMAGGFRPPTLQPLPSADADSLYDDLFASTPSTAPGGGGMARAPSAGGNLASARSGALNSVSGMGSGPLNTVSSGGGGGHGQQHQPPPPQQQQHQQQPPAYKPPSQPQSDLGDDLYGNLLPPLAPVQQQPQHQQQALLRDPTKLRQVLSTNPGLATMLAQAAASMGINLSAALGGGGAGPR